MLKFEKAMRAWGSKDFNVILKQEIEDIDTEQLPLQQALTTGNYVIPSRHTAMINSVTELGNVVRVSAGIFYKSVISGCSCADDPTPVNENEEYCVVRLDIDKVSAATSVTLEME